MGRGRLRCIYVLVSNILLLHVALETVREGSYQLGSIRYGWFTTGLFALAWLVLLVHLVALGVAVLVCGGRRAAHALAPALQGRPRLHLLERGLFIAFLYVNILYFDILVTGFQIQLMGYTAAYSTVKQLLYLIVVVVCVVLAGPARIQGFIRNNAQLMQRTATISLIVALALLGGRLGYKVMTSGDGAEAAYVSIPASDAPSVSAKMPNVIFLTFDELSATHMSLYGYHRETTPFLESLAGSTVVFDRAYTSSNWSAAAIPTFVLGTYPTTHQFRTNGFVLRRDNRENLVRVLESAGYAVRIRGYFLSDSPRGARSEYVEPLPGLQVKMYYSQDRPVSPLEQMLNTVEHVSRKLDRDVVLIVRTWAQNLIALHRTMWERIVRRPTALAGRAMAKLGIINVAGTPSNHRVGRSGGEGELEARFDKDFGLSELRRTLRDMKEPMFLWFHSRPPHTPFNPPAPYFGTYLKSQETYESLDAALQRDPWNESVLEKLVARYDEFVRYADAGLARMLEVVEEAGVLDRSLVIVASDHGLRHLNQNLRGFLVEEEIRVPLIVRLPKAAGGRRVKAPVGTVDIAPTVVDLLGLSVPSWMEGESLRAHLQGEPADGLEPKYVFSGERRHVAVIEGTQKSIFKMGSGTVWHTEVSSGGQGQSSLQEVSGEIAQRMKHELAARFGRHPRW
jgi:phosphoglycerol transferase MdoB-like AlkP superfamily enzyme